MVGHCHRLCLPYRKIGFCIFILFLALRCGHLSAAAIRYVERNKGTQRYAG